MDRFHQCNPASGRFIFLWNSPRDLAILVSFSKLFQSAAPLYWKPHLRKFVFEGFGNARSVFVLLRSYFLSQSLTLRKRFLRQGAHWLFKILYININFALERLESMVGHCNWFKISVNRISYSAPVITLTGIFVICLSGPCHRYPKEESNSQNSATCSAL